MVTAVAHLYNGTVLNIANVAAPPAYQALMERLGNATLPTRPPGKLARWQRWWNKKRGRPATADVGVLASLLAALRDATAAALSEHPLPNRSLIDRVAVTYPSMPALAREDIADALSYAGLRNWLGDSGGFQPHHVVEAQAAFAGNGHGLCPSQRPQHMPTLPPKKRWEPLTLLLLGGENATNGQFLDTLRSALAAASPSSSPPTMDIATVADPTFAAARGMAFLGSEVNKEL
ncbi:hypothetical protein SEUCBS140593_005029 [Sporothrix eucalyptigena]|uniref:Uncharacterized protein n=1 Tax=Sporothrix eucalyptigena TaxID=1812306 RepID=A0ABP0BTT7_9PEZI